MFLRNGNNVSEQDKKLKKKKCVGAEFVCLFELNSCFNAQQTDPMSEVRKNASIVICRLKRTSCIVEKNKNKELRLALHFLAGWSYTLTLLLLPVATF